MSVLGPLGLGCRFKKIRVGKCNYAFLGSGMSIDLVVANNIHHGSYELPPTL